MREGGNGLRLLLEPAQAVGISSERRRNQFDRDITFEPGVAGLIDLPHTASADECDDFIRTHGRTGQEPRLASFAIRACHFAHSHLKNPLN